MRTAIVEPIVFAAVMLAAALHATWNAIVKGSGEKHISMTAVVMGHVPLALVALPLSPLPAPESWPYLIAGIVLHVGYQLFLMMSYRVGDLTQVYPIARGIAPMLVALVSVLVLNVALSTAELIAIMIIGIGIMSLVFVRGNDGLHNGKAALMAVGTGCFIASYSLVDGLGAREAGTALGFYAWLTIINALAFMLIMRFTKPGTVSEVVKKHGRFALLGGGASFLAYALAIWAFTQAPIALVTAVRETSIIFALFIGVFFLGERLNLLKLCSTAMTIFGVLMLRLSR
ncbi:MAG: EamA family transporter [Alphaproteobacteria bacterium]|nr:EamA family transporter [Alphaproteobacteria bacterium]